MRSFFRRFSASVSLDGVCRGMRGFPLLSEEKERAEHITSLLPLLEESHIQLSQHRTLPEFFKAVGVSHFKIFEKLAAGSVQDSVDFFNPEDIENPYGHRLLTLETFFARENARVGMALCESGMHVALTRILAQLFDKKQCRMVDQTALKAARLIVGDFLAQLLRSARSFVSGSLTLIEGTKSPKDEETNECIRKTLLDLCTLSTEVPALLESIACIIETANTDFLKTWVKAGCLRMLLGQIDHMKPATVEPLMILLTAALRRGLMVRAGVLEGFFSCRGYVLLSSAAVEMGKSIVGISIAASRSFMGAPRQLQLPDAPEAEEEDVEWTFAPEFKAFEVIMSSILDIVEIGAPTGVDSSEEDILRRTKHVPDGMLENRTPGEEALFAERGVLRIRNIDAVGALQTVFLRLQRLQCKLSGVDVDDQSSTAAVTPLMGNRPRRRQLQEAVTDSPTPDRTRRRASSTDFPRGASTPYSLSSSFRRASIAMTKLTEDPSSEYHQAFSPSPLIINEEISSRQQDMLQRLEVLKEIVLDRICYLHVSHPSNAASLQPLHTLAQILYFTDVLSSDMQSQLLGTLRSIALSSEVIPFQELSCLGCLLQAPLQEITLTNILNSCIQLVSGSPDYQKYMRQCGMLDMLIKLIVATSAVQLPQADRADVTEREKLTQKWKAVREKASHAAKSDSDDDEEKDCRKTQDFDFVMASFSTDSAVSCRKVSQPNDTLSVVRRECQKAQLMLDASKSQLKLLSYVKVSSGTPLPSPRAMRASDVPEDSPQLVKISSIPPLPSESTFALCCALIRMLLSSNPQNAVLLVEGGGLEAVSLLILRPRYNDHALAMMETCLVEAAAIRSGTSGTLHTRDPSRDTPTIALSPSGELSDNALEVACADIVTAVLGNSILRIVGALEKLLTGEGIVECLEELEGHLRVCIRLLNRGSGDEHSISCAVRHCGGFEVATAILAQLVAICTSLSFSLGDDDCPVEWTILQHLMTVFVLSLRFSVQAQTLCDGNMLAFEKQIKVEWTTEIRSFVGIFVQVAGKSSKEICKQASNLILTSVFAAAFHSVIDLERIVSQIDQLLDGEASSSVNEESFPDLAFDLQELGCWRDFPLELPRLLEDFKLSCAPILWLSFFDTTDRTVIPTLRLPELVGVVAEVILESLSPCTTGEFILAFCKRCLTISASSRGAVRLTQCGLAGLLLQRLRRFAAEADEPFDAEDSTHTCTCNQESAALSLCKRCSNNTGVDLSKEDPTPQSLLAMFPILVPMLALLIRISKLSISTSELWCWYRILRPLCFPQESTRNALLSLDSSSDPFKPEHWAANAPLCRETSSDGRSHSRSDSAATIGTSSSGEDEVPVVNEALRPLLLRALLMATAGTDAVSSRELRSSELFEVSAGPPRALHMVQFEPQWIDSERREGAGIEWPCPFPPKEASTAKNAWPPVTGYTLCAWIRVGRVKGSDRRVCTRGSPSAAKRGLRKIGSEKWCCLCGREAKRQLDCPLRHGYCNRCFSRQRLGARPQPGKKKRTSVLDMFKKSKAVQMDVLDGGEGVSLHAKLDSVDHCAICAPPKLHLLNVAPREEEGELVEDDFVVVASKNDLPGGFLDISIQNCTVIVQTRKGKVIFDRSPLPVGGWTHVAIVHTKPRLGSQGTLSLFVNGVATEQAKLEYITSTDNPELLKAYCGIGLRDALSIRQQDFALGSLYLLTTVASPATVVSLYAAGPQYDGVLWGEDGAGTVHMSTKLCSAEQLAVLSNAGLISTDDASFNVTDALSMLKEKSTSRKSMRSFTVKARSRSKSASILQTAVDHEETLRCLLKDTLQLQLPVSPSQMLLAFRPRRLISRCTPGGLVMDSSLQFLLRPDELLSRKPCPNLRRVVMMPSEPEVELTAAVLVGRCSAISPTPVCHISGAIGALDAVLPMLGHASTQQEVLLTLGLLKTLVQNNMSLQQQLSGSLYSSALFHVLVERIPVAWIDERLMCVLFEMVGISAGSDGISVLHSRRLIEFLFFSVPLWKKTGDNVHLLLLTALRRLLVETLQEERAHVLDSLRAVEAVSSLLDVAKNVHVSTEVLESILEVVRLLLTSADVPKRDWVAVITALTTLSPSERSEKLREGVKPNQPVNTGQPPRIPKPRTFRPRAQTAVPVSSSSSSIFPLVRSELVSRRFLFQRQLLLSLTQVVETLEEQSSQSTDGQHNFNRMAHVVTFPWIFELIRCLHPMDVKYALGLMMALLRTRVSAFRKAHGKLLLLQSLVSAGSQCLSNASVMMDIFMGLCCAMHGIPIDSETFSEFSVSHAAGTSEPQSFPWTEDLLWVVVRYLQASVGRVKEWMALADSHDKPHVGRGTSLRTVSVQSSRAAKHVFRSPSSLSPEDSSLFLEEEVNNGLVTLRRALNLLRRLTLENEALRELWKGKIVDREVVLQPLVEIYFLACSLVSDDLALLLNDPTATPAPKEEAGEEELQSEGQADLVLEASPESVVSGVVELLGTIIVDCVLYRRRGTHVMDTLFQYCPDKATAVFSLLQFQWKVVAACCQKFRDSLSVSLLLNDPLMCKNMTMFLQKIADLALHFTYGHSNAAVPTISKKGKKVERSRSNATEMSVSIADTTEDDGDAQTDEPMRNSGRLSVEDFSKLDDEESDLSSDHRKSAEVHAPLVDGPALRQVEDSAELFRLCATRLISSSLDFVLYLRCLLPTSKIVIKNHQRFDSSRKAAVQTLPSLKTGAASLCWTITDIARLLLLLGMARDASKRRSATPVHDLHESSLMRHALLLLEEHSPVVVASPGNSGNLPSSVFTRAMCQRLYTQLFSDSAEMREMAINGWRAMLIHQFPSVSSVLMFDVRSSSKSDQASADATPRVESIDLFTDGFALLVPVQGEGESEKEKEEEEEEEIANDPQNVVVPSGVDSTLHLFQLWLGTVPDDTRSLLESGLEGGWRDFDRMWSRIAAQSDTKLLKLWKLSLEKSRTSRRKDMQLTLRMQHRFHTSQSSLRVTSSNELMRQQQLLARQQSLVVTGGEEYIKMVRGCAMAISAIWNDTPAANLGDWKLCAEEGASRMRRKIVQTGFHLVSKPRGVTPALTPPVSPARPETSSDDSDTEITVRAATPDAAEIEELEGGREERVCLPVHCQKSAISAPVGPRFKLQPQPDSVDESQQPLTECMETENDPDDGGLIRDSRGSTRSLLASEPQARSLHRRAQNRMFASSSLMRSAATDPPLDSDTVARERPSAPVVDEGESWEEEGDGGLGEAETSDADAEEFKADSHMHPVFTRILENDEKIVEVYDTARVDGMDTVSGILLFSTRGLYFLGGFALETQVLNGLQPNKRLNSVSEEDGGVSEAKVPPTQLESGVTSVDGTQIRIKEISRHEDWECAAIDTISRKKEPAVTALLYGSLCEVHKRRFLLRHVALEFFTEIGTTLFVVFDSPGVREQVFRSSLRYSPFVRSADIGLSTGGDFLRQLQQVFLRSSTERWKVGEISNYDYLMLLNTWAGRSFNDLTQYPVFPWTIADYESDVLNLSRPETFRDLSQPMGGLFRKKEFQQRFNMLKGSTEPPPFHYGTHYSSAPIVIHYLMRLQPFSHDHVVLQKGYFDHPDRLFHSIGASWESAAGLGKGGHQGTQDVKELVPEFYSLPYFLLNCNNFPLGTRQSGQAVDDVTLPPWSGGSSHDFIRLHRQALESEYVSQNLHKWIDLIFGFKQRGDAAEEAVNVFFYLTYEDAVDLDTVSDDRLRRAYLQQIHQFGQTPSQLFKSAHPQRTVSRSSGSQSDCGQLISRMAFRGEMPSGSAWARLIAAGKNIVGSSQQNGVPIQECPEALQPRLIREPLAADSQHWSEDWSHFSSGACGKIRTIFDKVTYLPLCSEVLLSAVSSKPSTMLQWGFPDGSLKVVNLGAKEGWSGTESTALVLELSTATITVCCVIPSHSCLVMVDALQQLTVWRYIASGKRSEVPYGGLFVVYVCSQFLRLQKKSCCFCGHFTRVLFAEVSELNDMLVTADRHSLLVWGLSPLSIRHKLPTEVFRDGVTSLTVEDVTGHIFVGTRSRVVWFDLNGTMLVNFEVDRIVSAALESVVTDNDIAVVAPACTGSTAPNPLQESRRCAVTSVAVSQGSSWEDDLSLLTGHINGAVCVWNIKYNAYAIQGPFQSREALLPPASDTPSAEDTPVPPMESVGEEKQAPEPVALLDSTPESPAPPPAKERDPRLRSFANSSRSLHGSSVRVFDLKAFLGDPKNSSESATIEENDAEGSEDDEEAVVEVDEDSLLLDRVPEKPVSPSLSVDPSSSPINFFQGGSPEEKEERGSEEAQTRNKNAIPDCDNPLPVWELQLRSVVRGHEHAVTALHATRDQLRLFSGDEDGTILSWTVVADPRETCE